MYAFYSTFAKGNQNPKIKISSILCVVEGGAIMFKVAL